MKPIFIKHLASCVAAFMLLAMPQATFAQPDVSVVLELDKRPTNPAVTPDGTVYFTMHPFDNPEYKILRLENGVAKPYPSEAISKSFAAVIGLKATQDGTLWWLDMGSKTVSPKLVGWDTKANKLKAIHVIPNEASVSNFFHQDFAVDEKRNLAFIADMSRGGLIDASEPAIVVVDLSTGQTRRVLQGNKIFQPGDNPIIAEGKPMAMKDDKNVVHELKLGLNPITIDPEFNWLYFGPMTPEKIHRISPAIIGDFTKTDAEIEAAFEVYSDKPSSDGMVAGKNGTLYISNVDQNAINIIDKTGSRIWTNDKRLVWVDGLCLAPDGSVYAGVNQLARDAMFNGGKSMEKKPYMILRISN